MNPLAKKYQEYLFFVTIQADEYPDMMPGLGLAGGPPGLAVQNPRNGQVFPYQGGISLATVEAFIVAIAEGRQKPWDGSPLDSESTTHDEL
jgi:protein disulfide-isomerase A1